MNIDSKKTLLSIAIPTKNRHKTLLITLDNMLRRMDDSVEFVICDNSDEELPSSLPLFLDKRIKYFYSSKTMSIVDNTENALSHCTGEFVCFIGDDDFVSP
ncbi:TPA: glycosyltransferase, partial [Escherichia coli]|nr:glycosyltransferase [Escherichia coli]